MTDWNHELDAQGLLCPEPVMMLHKKVREMEEGDVVKVVATDPSTTRDIPKFCHFLKYELVEQLQEGECYIYFIKKTN